MRLGIRINTIETWAGYITDINLFYIIVVLHSTAERCWPILCWKKWTSAEDHWNSTGLSSIFTDFGGEFVFIAVCGSVPTNWDFHPCALHTTSNKTFFCQFDGQNRSGHFCHLSCSIFVEFILLLNTGGHILKESLKHSKKNEPHIKLRTVREICATTISYNSLHPQQTGPY